MISLRTRFLIPWIAGLLFLLGVSGVGAQAAAATVRLDPAAVEVAAGTIQTIAVVLEDATDVYGIDVRARFDPALVEIVDADPAKAGVQVAPGAFPQPDFVALNEVDNGAGTLRYVITQVNPTPPATGSGTLFTIQVRGKAGGDSAISIELVEMSNRSGELLPVQTADGTIRVTGAAPPAPTGIVLATPAGGEQPPAAAAATATTTAANNQPLATTAATVATPANDAPAPAAAPGSAATQPAQQSGETVQSATGDTAGAAADAPVQAQDSGEPAVVAAGATGEPALSGEDPMAVAQAETMTNGTDVDQAASAATSAALAVVGGASPVDGAAPQSEEPADPGSSALMLAAAAAFTILIIAVVVLFLRRRAS